MNDWISVRSVLPKLWKDVLLHYADGTILIGCRFTDGFQFTNLYGKVTHWMALPEPPGTWSAKSKEA